MLFILKKCADNSTDFFQQVMRALLSELKIMIHLGQHLNVVNLLGAVTEDIANCEQVMFKFLKRLMLIFIVHNHYF